MALALVAVSISGLCCEPPKVESAVLVNVLLPSGDLEVDAIELWGYPDGGRYDEQYAELHSDNGGPLGQSFNLFVWIPPRWIGRTVWLSVKGYNDGVATSHGQTSVVPVKGRLVESTIVLVEGPPPCGNGVVDAGEQCDSTELAGQTCATVTGLPDGVVTCDQCALEISGCHDCGNGIIEAGGEACDGEELDGRTCQDLGFVTGELRCSDQCQLSLTLCEQGCGNGVIEDAEACDGTNLAGLGCPDFGFQRGSLVCDADCQYDVTGCAGTCGDAVLDPGESCDGSDFGDQDCLTAAGRVSGGLVCTDACHLDVSGCFTCGDGAIEGPEQCDGINLGGHDCLSVTGLPGGTLACAPASCVFDVSDCQ